VNVSGCSEDEGSGKQGRGREIWEGKNGRERRKEDERRVTEGREVEGEMGKGACERMLALKFILSS